MTTFSPTECKRLLELRKRAMTTGPWLCPAHRGEGSARTVEDTSGRRIVNCFPDQIDAGGPTLNELKELAKHRAAFIASAHSLADQLEAAIGVIEDTKEELTDVRERAEYYEQEAKDLRAHVAKLERGEFICRKCGLRKDAEYERGDF